MNRTVVVLRPLDSSAEPNADVLRLEVGLESLGSHLAPHATLFPAAERGLQLGHIVDVDAHPAKLQALRDEQGFANITAKYVGDQPVLGAVGAADHLPHILEGR